MFVLLKSYGPTEWTYDEQWGSFLFYIGCVFAYLVQGIAHTDVNENYWILYILGGWHLLYAVWSSTLFTGYFWNRDKQLPLWMSVGDAKSGRLSAGENDVQSMSTAAPVQYFYVTNIILRCINELIIIGLLLHVYFDVPFPIATLPSSKSTLVFPCALVLFELLTYLGCAICEAKLDAPSYWAALCQILGFLVGYPVVWAVLDTMDCKTPEDCRTHWDAWTTFGVGCLSIALTWYMVITFYLLVNRRQYMDDDMHPTANKATTKVRV